MKGPHKKSYMNMMHFSCYNIAPCHLKILIWKLLYIADSNTLTPGSQCPSRRFTPDRSMTPGVTPLLR